MERQKEIQELADIARERAELDALYVLLRNLKEAVDPPKEHQHDNTTGNAGRNKHSLVGS